MKQIDYRLRPRVPAIQPEVLLLDEPLSALEA
jgi:ABC-type sulfate/molybdate transport systems ATPase subunit